MVTLSSLGDVFWFPWASVGLLLERVEAADALLLARDPFRPGKKRLVYSKSLEKYKENFFFQ